MGSVLDGLSSAEAVAAIVGAGALIALVSFTSWGVKRVANFFGR